MKLPSHTEAHSFNAHIEEWKAWQVAPWGRIRYAVVLDNLRRHIPDGGLSVVDVGGEMVWTRSR